VPHPAAPAACGTVRRKCSGAVPASVSRDDAEPDLRRSSIASNAGVSSVERLAFTHTLIRDAPHEGLLASRRPAAAPVTSERHSHQADPRPHFRVLAMHFLAAAPAGTARKAAEYVWLAG
jgi:hypothetical protein